VRPLGKSALGLSCGLLGSGMAFDTALLRELPWSALGVTEDTGYHLRLVAAGAKVEFAPEARVSSPMPTTLDAAGEQRARWESGDVALAREAALPLLVSGLRARDVQRLHAGFELLMPPQSLLMALNAGTAAAAAALGARRAARLSLAALAAQITFVVGGLALVRAPAAVYRSLALAPVLALRNAGLYARLARGRGQREWVRTARD
jgi:Glycosyl transferase family group 2